MRCEDVIERMDAFRTRELPPRELRVIDRHMTTCPPCVEELATVEELARGCSALRVQAPRDLLEAVLIAAGDRYGVVETELGRVWVGFNERGVTLVHMGPQDPDAFERVYEDRLGRRPSPGEVPARYAGAVQAAAAGRGAMEVPVDLSTLPAFEREVLKALADIPRGEVRPYAWLAKEVGRPRAARAVGNACAKNPVPLLLACHRVVPTAGGVGNYGLGAPLKRVLLEREGVPLAELDRLAGGGVRYLGCKSTGIYCLPTCRDIRRARPENRVPFTSETRAAGAGYRPCRRCRPVARAA